MGSQLRLMLYEKARIDPAGIPRLIALHPDELKFSMEGTPFFLYRPRRARGKEPVPMVEKADELLKEMKELLLDDDAAENMKKV